MSGSVSLTRRMALSQGAAVTTTLWLGSSAPARAATADAEAIHRRALVLDSHVDVLLPETPKRVYPAWGGTYSDIDKLKAGKVDALVYAVAVSTGPRTPQGYAAAKAEADAKLAAIKAIPAETGGEAQIARSADDVRRIVGQGKVAILIGFLNAYSLGEDVDGFNRLAAEGVRVAGLVHAGNNAFADSSRPAKGTGEEHGGLSPLGKAAVTRLNDLGVLVDVSQLTPAGLAQTLALTRAPVAATHSAARGLVDSPRNLSDAELDAIKANGGVVQVTAFTSYLLPKPAGYDQALAALRAKYGLPVDGVAYQGADNLPETEKTAFFAAYRGLYPEATVKTYVDHIDYVAKRIGVDHVGVGTDFNHGAGIKGFKDESEAGAVTRELVARGYRQADIDKIWGGNFLRVLAAAQAAKRG
ncbi:dipeptidase [Caulobacter mirabilis]|nr:membrane dipeptidase [Caulobacter mirabilis]